MSDYYQGSADFMAPLTRGVLSKINAGIEARGPFDDVAKQCTAFYSGATGFMWEEGFQNRFLNGQFTPKFKLTLNKAFELVALYGPVLYWQNPFRTVRKRPMVELTPEMFGSQEDPEAMQLFQQMQQENLATKARHDAIRQILQLYLNYTPSEQPGGGLAQHAETAITEALVTGRGVLWPEVYESPGSDRVLTGSFWDSQNNLIIDPDATSLDDAWWIAQRKIEPYWQVEKKYGLPKDSLKGKAQRESVNAYAESSGDTIRGTGKQVNGETTDLLVYYKFWSKAGIGSRFLGGEGSYGKIYDKIERVVGDYAFMVVSEGVDYCLNAPSEKIKSSDDESIARMFEWPVPFYRDNRWPCCVLDFYRKPREIYPIAPLAPGLGELTYMNLYMSHLAGRTYTAMRDFIAVAESAYDHVRSTYADGDDLTLFKVPNAIGDVENFVKFLGHPDVNRDAWIILDKITDSFEKRVGLNELLYGLNPGGVQSRSATDAEAKREAVQVRPDYMAGKVEDWMTELADMEKLIAYWFVGGRDVVDIMGRPGAYLWDKFIVSEDPEIVVRETRVEVAANSARKPNKARDAQNVAQALQTILPVLDKHADITTDTGPINDLFDKWGEAVDMETENIMMGPRQPAPPSEEQMAMMQQQQQMEMQKEQMDLQKKQMEIEGKQIDIQGKVAQGQSGIAEKQLELQFKTMEHEQKAMQSEVDHEQKVMQSEEKHEVDLMITEEAHDLDIELALEKASIEMEIAKQKAKEMPNAGRGKSNIQSGRKKAEDSD